MPRYELETPICLDRRLHGSDDHGPSRRACNEHQLKWWREARFGVFIHWGLYAIPAGIWRGRSYKFISEWIMQQAQIPVSEYERLAAEFCPNAYDPEAWVRLALDAGARYLVITAKHHDGFALFDSRACGWNVVNCTPWGSDLLAPLADACHRQGLKLGFYYSQDQDWHHPHGFGNDWDFPDSAAKDFDVYLEEKVKPQLRELLTNYGPVALLWFDTPMSISPRQSEELASLVHELQPECLVSGRIGHGIGDYGSLEDNSIPNGPVIGDWEMPATMNDSWGYKVLDCNWKSPRDLIQQLAELAASGVNYLLNIGPDAEGDVPMGSQERLQIIGAWLKANGEAIYGTNASPFPYSFPWGAVTARHGRLYLLISKWQNRIQLNGVKNRIQRAYFLGLPDGDISCRQFQDDQTGVSSLILTLPILPPDQYVSCIVLEIEGEVEVDVTPTQDEKSHVRLPGQLAVVDDSVADGKPQIGFYGLIEQWKAKHSSVTWDFVVSFPGNFEVWIVSGTVSAHDQWWPGHRIRVEIAGQNLVGELTPDRDSNSRRSYYFPEKLTRMGVVNLSSPGGYRMTLSAEEINPHAPDGICIAEIQLMPLF